MRTHNSGNVPFLLFVAFALCSPSVVKAGAAKCYIAGIISPSYQNKSAEVPSNMIRLHFEASEKKKCEDYMTSYCETHITGKQYSPTKVKGSFKPDMEKPEETKYSFGSKCELISE